MSLEPNEKLSKVRVATYIVIDNETAKEINIPLSDRILGSLSAVNVFVGQNNSGKSRFLRSIFSADISATKFILEEYEENHLSVGDLSNWLQKFFITNSGPFSNSRISKLSGLIYSDLSGDLTNVIEFCTDFYKKSESSNSRYQEFNDLLKSDQSLAINFKRDYSELINVFPRVSFGENPRRMYIPILRGLRPINKNGDRFDNGDAYSDRTRFDYFRPSSQENEIFSGLSMYEDIKKLLLGREDQRKLIRDFEIFLKEQVFDENITLIPKYNSDVLEIKIGAKDQFPIFNLGDGLQTIITILFPVFVGQNKKRCVFIEEPETHLHPHWQAKLLNALKSIPNQQYFITTHSTTFINDKDSAVFNISEQNDELRIQKVEFDHQKLSILKDLGYKQSDLLQANYILWVEGPSDKIYLENWIKQLAPELVEGSNYTILLFGGSNYKHIFIKNSIVSLDIVKSINRNFGIILDSDKSSESADIKRDLIEIKQYFDHEELFCWITNAREVENYLEDSDFENAVRHVHDVKNISIALGEYSDRNKVENLDSKREFKATIKIPQELMAIIQKNKDGSTKKIEDSVLREGIEKAIQATSKTIFEINKIEVAKRYISTSSTVPEGELGQKLKELIVKIKEANHINL